MGSKITDAEQVITSFPTCPIGEVARLGRTLRTWRAQVLAYFHTGGVGNGGTEAINLLIQKTSDWPPAPARRVRCSGRLVIDRCRSRSATKAHSGCLPSSALRRCGYPLGDRRLPGS